MKKLVLGSIIAVAAVLSLALPAGAVENGDGGDAAARTTPASLDPPSEADREFLITAARVGLAEILQGVVASQRGTDEGVRQYGNQMINDHFGQILQQLPIHLIYGVPVPATTPEQDAQLAALITEPATTFDQTYLTAQVAAHTQAIELFRSAAEGADNVFVAAFAAQQLPVLEMHLMHAQELLDSTQPEPAPVPVPEPAPEAAPVPA